MLTHIHPSRRRFTCRTRPIFNGYGYPGPESGASQGPPGAQSPFARARRYLARRGVTLNQNPLAGFGCPYSGESLQVVVSPCWEVALPGVISANLSPHAWTYTPVLPLVHLPVSSQETSAFSASGSARHSTTIRTATSVRGRISGLSIIHSCSGLRICSPPRSLLPQCFHWAAVAFTSEPITVCYLPAHRIC